MGTEQFGRGNYQAKLVEAGVWVNIPFHAANFYAEGGLGTWAVTTGNIIVNRYALVGDVGTWNVKITGSTVAGTVGDSVYINAPVVLGHETSGVGFGSNTTGLTYLSVQMKVAAFPTPSRAVIQFLTADISAGNLEIHFTSQFDRYSGWAYT